MDRAPTAPQRWRLLERTDLRRVALHPHDVCVLRAGSCVPHGVCKAHGRGVSECQAEHGGYVGERAGGAFSFLE